MNIYLIGEEHFKTLQDINKALFGDGSTLTPDRRRDLANLMCLTINNIVRHEVEPVIKPVCKPKLVKHYYVTSLTAEHPERIVRCFQEIHKRVSIDGQWDCPPIPAAEFDGLTEQEAKTLISRWNELGEGRYKYELMQA